MYIYVNGYRYTDVIFGIIDQKLHHISLWSSVLELDPQAGLGTLKREGECLE